MSQTIDQDPSSENNMNQVLSKVLGDILNCNWHQIRDDYGNVYRVFDKKDENGKWYGDIWNKRTRKCSKSFMKTKKRLVWDILYRHFDKKNEQYKKAHTQRDKKMEGRDD